MNAETTGRFIASLRKEKNMTQQQFAEIINVSDKAVSRWETGRGFPDINSLEDISSALDISVAELLKGERLDDAVGTEDVSEIAKDSFDLARQFISKKKLRNILIGFLTGILVTILLVVHMTSPIRITGADNALTVETMSGGTVTAVMNGSVAGYDMEEIQDPDSGAVTRFISCYDTRWHQLTGKSGQTIAVIGHAGDGYTVFYYPGTEGDELIYSEKEPSGYPVTLRRLVYNYWMIIWGVLGMIGLIFWHIRRNKYNGGRVLKIAMIPVSLLLGHVAVLSMHSGAIYSAQFYFSGILLAAACIYVLFLLLYGRKKK